MHELWNQECSAEFVPKCAFPFNKALHELLPRKEITFSSMNELSVFKYHVRDSNYYCVDFHGSPSGLDRDAKMGIGQINYLIGRRLIRLTLR